MSATALTPQFTVYPVCNEGDFSPEELEVTAWMTRQGLEALRALLTCWRLGEQSTIEPWGNFTNHHPENVYHGSNAELRLNDCEDGERLLEWARAEFNHRHPHGDVIEALTSEGVLIERGEKLCAVSYQQERSEGYYAFVIVTGFLATYWK